MRRLTTCGFNNLYSSGEIPTLPPGAVDRNLATTFLYKVPFRCRKTPFLRVLFG